MGNVGDLPGDPAVVGTSPATLRVDVVDALEASGPLSTSELSARLNFDSSKIEAELRGLKQDGLVKSGRWRRWSLVQPHS